MSFKRKPLSTNFSAVLNDVHVSLPLWTASAVTHIITPPSFNTRYNSFITPFMSYEYPLYFLMSSYGGDVITMSMEESAKSFIPLTQSMLYMILVFIFCITL